MRLYVLKNIKEAIKHVPVFIVPDGSGIEKHSFAGTLSPEDKRYLLAFEKKSPIKDGHTHLLFLPSGREAILLGVSKGESFTHRKALTTARRIVAFARRERVSGLALCLDDFVTGPFRRRTDELAALIATQCEIANFEFTRYRTAPTEGWPFVKDIGIYSTKTIRNFGSRIKEGQIIGEEINGMRELSNTPGADMSPKILAEAARKLGKAHDFSVKVLGVPEMTKLGMGGVLGVGKGSDHAPCFIVIEYWGGKPPRKAGASLARKGGKEEKPVVLIGKGVTFDAGGLNLKPESGLLEMHMDMSGGASVIHTVAALARLKMRQNVIGLIPAVENMPSGKSYRPADVLRTMSGKTIEVLNTDAEGRVILADAITYAKRYNPRVVIDLATLTGAAMAALGQRASALFSTDRALENKLREIGEERGDLVWPLPLWEEYEGEVKGTFGDVANIGKTRYGGAITGAMFLWQFVKDAGVSPWVHIDIAPRMTSIEGDYLAKGSAGPGVALLIGLLSDF